MKKQLFNLTLGLIMAATVAAKADIVNVPSGCFQSLSTNVSFPLLNTVNYQLGSWAMQLWGLVPLVGSVQVGTAAAIGGPAPVTGTNEMGIFLPLGVGVGATLSQNLTNMWLSNSTYTLTVALDPATDVTLFSKSTLALRAGNNNVVAVSSNVLVGLFTGGTGYKTVTISVKTGTTVPNSAVRIYLNIPSVASVGGSVFVDNFALSVVPNQVVLTASGTGSNLTLNGSGGAPNQQFAIITSTNLLSPPSAWAQLATSTNQFDANGNFIVGTVINRLTPYRFFRLVLQ